MSGNAGRSGLADDVTRVPDAVVPIWPDAQDPCGCVGGHKSIA